MNLHASGFVDLTSDDISVTIEALDEERIFAGLRCGRSPDRADDEHQQAYVDWIDGWLGRLSAMPPGLVCFSAYDMERLRGVLFSMYMPRQTRKYRNAVMKDDIALVPMARRLQHLACLEDKMRNPSAAIGTLVCLDRHRRPAGSSAMSTGGYSA